VSGEAEQARDRAALADELAKMQPGCWVRTLTSGAINVAENYEAVQTWLEGTELMYEVHQVYNVGGSVDRQMVGRATLMRGDVVGVHEWTDAMWEDAQAVIRVREFQQHSGPGGLVIPGGI
jgi:hypothetical protein